MYGFLIWWFTDDDPVVFEIIWPRHLFDLGNNCRRINVLSLQVKMLIQTPFYSFTCRFSWKKYEIQIVCFKYNIYKINNTYIHTLQHSPPSPVLPKHKQNFLYFYCGGDWLFSLFSFEKAVLNWWRVVWTLSLIGFSNDQQWFRKKWHSVTLWCIQTFEWRKCSQVSIGTSKRTFLKKNLKKFNYIKSICSFDIERLSIFSKNICWQWITHASFSYLLITQADKFRIFL